MSVEITPATQLGFHRPLTRLVTQTIKIHNPHPHPVAFKVKTTAPKQYCVRPNSGRVESGESVEVSVLLQPLAADPPPHAKCKDKFLVQSAFITPDEEMHTLSEMWSATETNNKSAIQEQKIKCVYLAAEDGKAENGIKEEDEDAGMESRVMDESTLFTAAQSSPAPKVNGTADRSTNTGGSGGLGGLAAALPSTLTGSSGLNTTVTPITRSVPTTSAPSAQPESSRLPDLTPASAGLSGTGVSPTNSALEKSLEATTSDSEKLRVAMAEIERLQSQLNNASSGSGSGFGSGSGDKEGLEGGPQVTGLRRRGGAGGAGTVGEQAKEGAEVMLEKAKQVASASTSGQGVPVEVVAALVIGVFVMTYLFF